MKILENTLGTSPTHAWGGYVLNLPHSGEADNVENDVYGSVLIQCSDLNEGSVVSDEILEAHHGEVHAILYSVTRGIGIRVTQWGVEHTPFGVEFSPNRWYEKD